MTAITGGFQGELNFSYLTAVTVTKAANTIQGVTTFTHNLNYRPPVIAYVLSSTPIGGSPVDVYYQTPWNHLEAAGTVGFKMDVVSDADTVNCYVITPNITSVSNYYANAYTVTFYVYIAKQDITNA